MDSLNDSGYRADWSHHKRINKIANAEANSNVDALISVCRDNLLDINAASSSKMLSYLNDADYGFQLNGLSTNPFDMNKVAEQMNIYVSNNNQLCDALDNKLALTEDFIQYAKLKANN